jgi:DNA repair protein RecO (recombination protein O)
VVTGGGGHARDPDSGAPEPTTDNRHPLRENARVNLYRDEGVVLRTQKLGEADRIITLLTRSHGRVRAVAKGVRRTRSKFGARLEPFSHVDAQLYTGRSLDVVTQVETIGAYGGPLVGRLPVLHRGNRDARDGRAVHRRGARTRPCSSSCSSSAGLRALAAGERDPVLLLDSFLLRSLAVAGYAPTFDACARCGVDGRTAPSPSRSAARCASGAGRRARSCRGRRRSPCSRLC